MLRTVNVELLIKLSAKFVTFALVSFAFTQVFAAPLDIENYDIVRGGLAEIHDGAYVEGSVRNGGSQPDYLIDLTSEPLKSILQKCESIKSKNLSFWDKVGMVVEIIQQDVFEYTNYRNPYYLRLLKKHRLSGSDVPLSEYATCRAGVCREHALLLHFALKAAGIENRHVYAQIYRASQYHDYEITEDHAFNVVKRNGVEWVVDAYYWGFNGFRLKDLMSRTGITENSVAAPIASPRPGTRRIEHINSFPVIYNPKTPKGSCSVFSAE